MQACISALKSCEHSNLLNWVTPRSATETELKWIHNKEYIEHIKSVCNSGGGYLDPDTPVCPESYSTALKSAGSWLVSVDEVINGNSAFSLSRPPGHHAEVDRAMGFCLFSNAALAATYAIKKKGLTKVAIFDWDVHHGNGTQHIVQSKSNIAYVSIHQFPFYPGTGLHNEKGEYGNVLNIPVPSGYGSNEYKQIIDEKVFPFIKLFSPELLIISAGFDAHKDDPLAGLNLTEKDYAYMIKCCLKIQPRLMLGLEGGYNLDALGKCCVSVVNELVL